MPEMRDEFAKILTAGLLKADMTQAELAKALGCSTSTVSDWCNGRKYPRPEKMSRLTTLLNLADASSLLSAGILPLPATRNVPLLGIIACGSPILAQENRLGEVPLPEQVTADFALRCKGDSMKDARILDGDLVYIHAQPDLENGEIGAVLIGEEATLKRVYFDPADGGRLTLVAANAAYPPMVFTADRLGEVRILGKAVAFLSTI